MKTYAGFLISQIRQISGRIFEKILKESGVEEFNGAQGRILYVLWEHNSLTISEIARLTSLANTTLTSMLGRMEKQSLIERRPDPDNRRQIIITAAEGAEKLRSEYERVSDLTNEIYYAGFSEEEILLFESMLRRILRNHENAEQNPSSIKEENI